ncbi:putative BTB/POZ domain-containing protein 16 [Apostichopus japonicus]|uniref:Putative BTB/POZ domain-containing protein 16 n=1 Tax=Stichopus japonicus TaxID=307972 RepID=A0A2G8KND1_STIJA|nr:putative BTB/POZ domain-containing protein 16 [Apostichopus japonicus]
MFLQKEKFKKTLEVHIPPKLLVISCLPCTLEFSEKIVHCEPRYHTQTISVHGFHFELKAHRQGSDPTYQFYIQRLKPQDSTLSFRICERQTFSLRQDREVLYSIRVQCKAKGQDYCYSTGMRNKKFGLGSTTSKSDIFTLNDLCLRHLCHLPTTLPTILRE